MSEQRINGKEQMERQMKQEKFRKDMQMEEAKKQYDSVKRDREREISEIRNIKHQEFVQKTHRILESQQEVFLKKKLHIEEQ